MDAARLVRDDVNGVLQKHWRRIIEPEQLQQAANSVTSNIREAYGRRRGPDRTRFFRYALGSCEETDERLLGNCRASCIDPVLFRRNHQRLAVIARILNKFVDEDEAGHPKKRR